MSKSAALPLAGFLGIATISLAATSTVAMARSLEALQSPDPARETAAPADPGFAASCRTAARKLLGEGSFRFGPPAYASRNGESVVRMEISVPGVARRGLFRAACVRNRQTRTVEAAVFDAPADDVGPRVIALAGPEGGGAPAPDYVIGFNYSGLAPGLAYRDPYGYPGLAAPLCPACAPFAAPDPAAPTPLPGAVTFLRRQSGITLRTQPGVALRGGPTTPAPAAPSTSFGGVVRMGMGGFVR